MSSGLFWGGLRINWQWVKVTGGTCEAGKGWHEISLTCTAGST
jgi:hypothetical protein